jgi:hypothetical protein
MSVQESLEDAGQHEGAGERRAGEDLGTLALEHRVEPAGLAVGPGAGVAGRRGRRRRLGRAADAG